jgi:hypothetical protein
MPYIDIDIDVEDFYDELNRCEKEELIELLEQDGFLEKKQVFRASEDADGIDGNPVDHEWAEMMNKINQSRYQLTPEQEDILINLAKSL